MSAPSTNDPDESTGRRSGRRRFLSVLGGTLCLSPMLLRRVLAAPVGLGTGNPARTPRPASEMKLAHRVDLRSVTDEDLLFLHQIGLRWVRAEFGPAPLSFEELRAAKERLARHGLGMCGAVHGAYTSLKIQLGLPGRDEPIEIYQAFLRHMGRLGVPVASYDFHPANTYATALVQHRGYTVREFSLPDFRARVEKSRFEREYGADEIWANYTYFMKAVLPVAEAAGVKLALHPDDPPVAKMNGVAKLFINYDGIHRAEQVAGNSPNWGLNFCVGTWAEGGAAMGRDVFEMIREFGGRGRLFDVHFRNVTSPLPSFIETFPDDGYVDMYAVMKALQAVGYTGSIEPDHIPLLEGDAGPRRSATAYCIAYIRALQQRAAADAR